MHIVSKTYDMKNKISNILTFIYNY